MTFWVIVEIDDRAGIFFNNSDIDSSCRSIMRSVVLIGFLITKALMRA